MQVDFYQLSRDPVERVAPLLAAKVLDTGERLLVVSGDAARRAALAQALWGRENAFLARGAAGEPHAACQPFLLGEHCEAANGARIVLIADGLWRAKTSRFKRAILLFGSKQTAEARLLWTTQRIVKQGEGGGWREGR